MTWIGTGGAGRFTESIESGCGIRGSRGKRGVVLVLPFFIVRE